MAVGLVTKVSDSIDALGAREVGDLLNECGLVDLVGELRDDDLVAVALCHLFNMHAGTDHDAAAPLESGADGVAALGGWSFAVKRGKADGLIAEDDAAGREIGAL